MSKIDVSPKMKTLSIRRGFDLRMKMSERHHYAKADCVVVLVNNKHSICNIILHDDPEFIGRRKLPTFLKGVSNQYLERFLLTKLAWLMETQLTLYPDPMIVQEDFKSSRAFAYYSKKRRKGAQ